MTFLDTGTKKVWLVKKLPFEMIKSPQVLLAILSLKMEYTSSNEMNVSVPGSWETGAGFSWPQVHTVMVWQVSVGHDFLPITVWMSSWENHFQFPNFPEEAFSDITVLSQQISPLWKYAEFHHQEIHFINKEDKSPGGVSCLKITDFLSTRGLLLRMHL